MLVPDQRMVTRELRATVFQEPGIVKASDSLPCRTLSSYVQKEALKNTCLAEPKSLSPLSPQSGTYCRFYSILYLFPGLWSSILSHSCLSSLRHVTSILCTDRQAWVQAPHAPPFHHLGLKQSSHFTWCRHLWLKVTCAFPCLSVALFKIMTTDFFNKRSFVSMDRREDQITCGNYKLMLSW